VTENRSLQIGNLKTALESADAVLITPISGAFYAGSPEKARKNKKIGRKPS